VSVVKGDANAIQALACKEFGVGCGEEVVEELYKGDKSSGKRALFESHLVKEVIVLLLPEDL
jgi:hypothetical protein